MHWKILCDKNLFQSEISCTETWHNMYFRENNKKNKNKNFARGTTS